MNKMFLANDFWKQPPHADAYLAKAQDFMREWQEGREVFVLHTSGSTGIPKPVQVTRKQLTSSALATGRALGLGAGTRALVCLNINYVAGLMMLVRGMVLDWQLTVIQPSANPLLDIPKDAAFDFTALVPMQLAHILENSESSQSAEKLGKILLGGAPVSTGLLHEIARLKVPVYQSYGMTETVSHIAMRKLNLPAAEDRYTFLPGIQFDTDARGCLRVSGEVTNHEMVQTNDLVEIEENAFRWIGRADNVINSGGVKIVLDQVDAQLASVFFELNLTNAFFSWWEMDEKLGQKLVLVIEGKLGKEATEQIFREIRTRSSAYQSPKHIYFADQFFKTPTGKVDKRNTFQAING